MSHCRSDRLLLFFPAAVSDVMQVEVIRTYTAKQPDELSLQVADVVLLSQTVEDGMFHPQCWKVICC